MKIAVLSENYVSKRGIKGEHGLSLYIETNDEKILFDMGQGENFYNNAISLGIDVENVSVAVVSHGHYDHGGGIKTFLDKNQNAFVFVNKNAFGRFYSKNGYIGLDESLTLNKRLVCTESVTEILSFASLYSGDEVPIIENNYSNGLEKEENSVRTKDDFAHEQYLLVEENGKRILFSGCSHRGILNLMSFFKPDVFVGGFHLVSLDCENKELITIANKLNEYNTVYYTCHCTGIEQYGVMKEIMGRKLKYICCGDKVDI